eukprot:g30171.t1
MLSCFRAAASAGTTLSPASRTPTILFQRHRHDRPYKLGSSAFEHSDHHHKFNWQSDVGKPTLGLYRKLLRASERFPDYNFKKYALRRVKEEFRANRDVSDPNRLEALVKDGEDNLQMIHRQATIGSFYHPQPTIDNHISRPRLPTEWRRVNMLWFRIPKKNQRKKKIPSQIHLR